MKKIILFVVILVAGIGFGLYLQKQPKTQKIETQVQKDTAQVGADVKEGMQKAGDVATNVAAEVKAGAQKAGEVATNVVGEAREKLK